MAMWLRRYNLPWQVLGGVTRRMKPMVLDIGGTNVKAWSPDGELIDRLPTGPSFTPFMLMAHVDGWKASVDCDCVAIGYPGPVVAGRPAREPWNLGDGWLELDYNARLELPVRIMNDAAMQALGSYTEGSMLFLGLGTSVGSAMVVDGLVIPLELGSIPYSRNRTLEDMLSRKGLDKHGTRVWRKALLNALPKLRNAFGVEYIVLGGGNAIRAGVSLPDFVRMGDNKNAYVGGIRLWEAKDFRRVHWISYDAISRTQAEVS